jgi:ribose 5-phosphate isomerase B
MHLLLAADHAGYDLKEALKSWLLATGEHTLEDFGTHSSDSMDYPDVVHPLAKELSNSAENVLGILVCGSGQGVCMTANKYPHIRAALVWQPNVAALTRQHNNANVMCLPARFISLEDAKAATQAFISTPLRADGTRYA